MSYFTGHNVMTKRCVVWLAGILLLAGVFSARTKDKFSFTREGGYKLMNVTEGPNWTKYFHQGFNMQLWISNAMTNGCEAVAGQCGGIGPDGKTLFGLEYPLGSGIEHLFGGGPWIGGLVNGIRHVDEGYNGDDARTEFQPNLQDTLRDKMWVTSVGDTLYDPNRPGYYKKPMNRLGYDDDGDGKIDEDELDGIDNDGDWNPLTDDIGADGVPDSLEVGCKGGFDPVRNPDPAYDDYLPSKHDSCHPDIHGAYPLMKDKNKYTEKNGLPDHGEPHVDEDYGAVSDQDVYCASTDTFNQKLGSPAIGHFPMGVKCELKSYAWRGDFADGILPVEYKFINVQKYNITNVFVGMFNDYDVGPYTVSNYPTHNYAAYIPQYRTGYVMNPLDRGSTPAGLTVLHTPRPLDSLQYVWQWHGFNDPGTIDSLIYARMAWIGYDTTQRIKPSQSPTNLSDTRFYFAFGPFDTLRPPSARKPGGDTLDIIMCYVGGYAVDQGPHNLQDNAANALKFYAAGWQPPFTLATPCMKIDTGFKRIVLHWGGKVQDPTRGVCVDPTTQWDLSSSIAESYPDSNWRRINPPANAIGPDGKVHGGRSFEGYRVYRSEDPNGAASTFALMGQWDIKDSLTAKFGVPNDYDTGLDTITYHCSCPDSGYYIVDTNLVRGKIYWYAVTAYGIPDRTVIPVKDNLGNTTYDTLFAANGESPMIPDRIDLPFSPSSIGWPGACGAESVSCRSGLHIRKRRMGRAFAGLE